MNDRILFIGWSAPARGREEHALEVFDESLALYGRMQQEGRIERFDVCILDPTTDLGGWIALHGTSEQLAAVREDEAFRKTLVDAELAVDGMRLCGGSTGEALARDMEIFREAVHRVPQLT